MNRRILVAFLALGASCTLPVAAQANGGGFGIGIGLGLSFSTTSSCGQPAPPGPCGFPGYGGYPPAFNPYMGSPYGMSPYGGFPYGGFPYGGYAPTPSPFGGFGGVGGIGGYGDDAGASTLFGGTRGVNASETAPPPKEVKPQDKLSK